MSSVLWSKASIQNKIAVSMVAVGFSLRRECALMNWRIIGFEYREKGLDK